MKKSSLLLGFCGVGTTLGVIALVACSSTTTPSPSPDASFMDGSTNDSACGPSGSSGTGCVAACISAGGSCIGVSECSPDKGHLGAYSCGSASASIACCFTPATSCGGDETFRCCAGTAVFRPSCKDGALVCLEGQTKCSVDGG
jgi:hypothetical protein